MQFNFLPAAPEWAIRLTSFVVFDVIWLAAVWGRQDWWWLTAILLLFMLLISARVLLPVWRTWAVLVGGGLVLEAVVLATGALSFTGGWLPGWLILLWLGFPAMALVVLDWLRGRYLLAAAFGVVAGPFTYVVGARLGAAQLHWAEVGVGALYAVLWGLYMVGFVYGLQRVQAKGETHA